MAVVQNDILRYNATVHKNSFKILLIALTFVSTSAFAQAEKFVIVVNKTAHDLKVYRGAVDDAHAKDIIDVAHWQESHPVTLGIGGLADKQKEGDNLVPEGTYHVIAKLDLSKRISGKNWNKAFVLDYPNEQDRSKGKTGGGIWIHGFAPNEHDAYEQRVIDEGIGWSEGCVVLRNPEIDDLFFIIPPLSPGKLIQTKYGPVLRTEIPKELQPTVIINH